MSHYTPSHHSLFNTVFHGICDILSRPHQPLEVLSTYSRYVSHHPALFTFHSLAALYSGYRLYQLYQHKEEMGWPLDKNLSQRKNDLNLFIENEHGSLFDYIKRNRKLNNYDSKLDNYAMLINTFSFVAAINWSVSPLLPCPQAANLILYAVAEIGYYLSETNEEHRRKCKIQSNDSIWEKVKKCSVRYPILNSTFGQVLSV